MVFPSNVQLQPACDRIGRIRCLPVQVKCAPRGNVHQSTLLPGEQSASPRYQCVGVLGLIMLFERSTA